MKIKTLEELLKTYAGCWLEVRNEKERKLRLGKIKKAWIGEGEVRATFFEPLAQADLSEEEDGPMFADTWFFTQDRIFGISLGICQLPVHNQDNGQLQISCGILGDLLTFYPPGQECLDLEKVRERK